MHVDMIQHATHQPQIGRRLRCPARVPGLHGGPPPCLPETAPAAAPVRAPAPPGAWAARWWRALALCRELDASATLTTPASPWSRTAGRAAPEDAVKYIAVRSARKLAKGGVRRDSHRRMTEASAAAFQQSTHQLGGRLLSVRRVVGCGALRYAAAAVSTASRGCFVSSCRHTRALAAGAQRLGTVSPLSTQAWLARGGDSSARRASQSTLCDAFSFTAGATTQSNRPGAAVLMAQPWRSTCSWRREEVWVRKRVRDRQKTHAAQNRPRRQAPCLVLGGGRQPSPCCPACATRWRQPRVCCLTGVAAAGLTAPYSQGKASRLRRAAPALAQGTCPPGAGARLAGSASARRQRRAAERDGKLLRLRRWS